MTESALDEDFVACSSRWRLLLLISGSLAFVAMGLWMGGVSGDISSSPSYPAALTFVIGWLCVIFFATSCLALVKRMLGSAEQLRINRVGIRWTSWSNRMIPWSAINYVTRYRVYTQTFIVLHLHDPAAFPVSGILYHLSGANKTMTGGDISISTSGTNRSFNEAFSAIQRFRV